MLEEVVELDGDNLTPLTNLEHLYTCLSLWQELLENPKSKLRWLRVKPLKVNCSPKWLKLKASN